MSQDAESLKRRLDRRLLAQRNECEALLPLVSGIDAIVQVGLGNWWEGPYLLKQFPKARYHGIEVIKRYCETTKASGFPGQIIHGAAWDKTGEMRTLQDRRDRTDMFSVPTRRRFTVETFALDDVIEESGRIFLWLDCEGSELKAMIGAPKLMSMSVYIQVEYMHTRGHGASAKEIIHFLKRNGFKQIARYRALSLFKRWC